MKTVKCFLVRLLDDDRGQSTTEYILILSVVVMIAMKFKQTFGAKINTITESLTTEIGSATQQQ